MTGNDPGAAARGIVDANLYMVLATADASGRPWASPVYFAHADYTELYWVSSPEATHSRNIAVRPEVSIVIFDSRVPVGAGQGVYMTAVAEELAGAELGRGLEVFSPFAGHRRRGLGGGRGDGRGRVPPVPGDGLRALDARQGRHRRPSRGGGRPPARRPASRSMTRG